MDTIAPQDKLTELKAAFSTAQKVLVLLRKDPSFDALAAGLSLYLAMKKAGKDTSIYCETPIIVEYANLVGVDKIRNEIGNKNLIIAFDYVEGAIEKVSYNISDNKFNLVIQPKSGFLPISPEKISYSYSGLSADLVFIIECQKLMDLGKIAEKEKDFFEKTSTVSIDYHQNVQFAKFNVNTTGVLSCSELTVNLFQSLNLKTDGDIATNLLSGMEYTTSGFSDPRLDATTFETIAYLLRQGAKRQKVPSLAKPALTIAPITATGVRIEEKKEEKEKESLKPPVDWLQPKVYKGGQLL